MNECLTHSLAPKGNVVPLFEGLNVIIPEGSKADFAKDALDFVDAKASIAVKVGAKIPGGPLEHLGYWLILSGLFLGGGA